MKTVIQRVSRSLSVWMWMLMVMILSGCVTVPETPEQESAPLSITSSPQQHFSLADFDGLIFEPIIPVKLDPMFPNRENVYQKLQTTIASQLMSKMGIRQNEPAGNPLVVRFGIASNSTVSDAQLVRFFGITPGLVTEPDQEKLTIAISLIRASSGEPLWKGVAQGTVIPGITVELRQARAEEAVARMLSSL